MVLYEPFEGRVFQIPESLAMGRVQNQKDIQAETGIGKEPIALSLGLRKTVFINI